MVRQQVLEARQLNITYVIAKAVVRSRGCTSNSRMQREDGRNHAVIQFIYAKSVKFHVCIQNAYDIQLICASFRQDR